MICTKIILSISLASDEFRQAIGKSKEQVYKRLEAKEVRTTDVFHVVLVQIIFIE
jgi:hypothetical protein